jgi:hypothetical protein
VTSNTIPWPLRCIAQNETAQVFMDVLKGSGLPAL